jgi:hypothetical protein
MTYHVRIKSFGIIPSPRMLCYWWNTDRMRKIRAPRGYHWNRDAFGIRLVDRHGNDYHPNAAELLAGIRFITAKIRSNAATRRQVAREMRRELASVKRAEREGCAVCVADSVRAGNCAVGTREWARRHNLDPSRHYTPSELLAISNGDGRRVALVVSVALRRHRKEMERGFALLAEHTN